MSITGLAIKRPILFTVFFIVLGGLGIFAYSKLKYELLPDLATPFVTVITTYPGASPGEVENSVTKKIEDGVAGVSKIKRLTSNSAENLSIVTIEFTADADADKAVQEVQRALTQIAANLPSGVKSPSVEKLNVNDAPVLRLGITSNLSEEKLYTLVDNQVRSRFSQLSSVGRVTLLGGAKKEIKVYVDAQKLASYGISNLEISAAVQKSNADIPLGSIKDVDADLGVRLSGKVTDFDQILNQPVRTMADGSTIKVGDVVRIETATKDVEVLNRLDRKPSIGLFVSKQSGANAVEVSNLVRAEIAKLETEYKNIGLTFSIAQDSSEFTLTAANAVYKDFFIAVALVALVMLVFLHSLRNSFIVMLAIPTSLFSAFIMMYIMDYSLNLMTLLAMSLVIGILVDDSIVVLENIYRHLEMGKDKQAASLEGRNEIGFAALSITLVDVVVFLPMALVPGLVGSLVKQFSLVIVVSTLSSLIVSFTLTPMIASRFARLEHLNPKTFFGKIGTFFEKRIEAFIDFYERILRWSLRHKVSTLAIVLALLAGSFLLVGAGFVGTEFSPATDKGELSLLINTQPGTRLEETDKAVKSIEKKLSALPEVTKLFTTTGYQSDGFNELYNSNVAAINISLVPQKDRAQSLNDVSRQIRKLAMEVPGVKARVSPIGLLGANDAPVQLLLSGDSRDTLLAQANKLIEGLRTIPGIVTPRLSAEQGKPEIDVTINREKAALLGLDMETVGASLRTAINGYDELKFRTGDQDVDVRIQLEGEERNSTAGLSQYRFTNDKGQVVYLNQFAQVNLRTAPSFLERRNKQPSVLLLSQVVGRPVGDVGEDIVKWVTANPVSDGVRLSYEGDLELQSDSFGQLGLALAASLLLIYLIMVALYNNWTYPFVVLFSIPVALVGALLALALTANSLNIFTIFGLIMMMGLVAKNAILLVDRANEVRPHAVSLTDALIDAGRTRLRPILMTTMAMVIGMLPLALAKGAAAELNSGLAWVLIGGLTSSMFLTLIVVPVIYYGITRILEKRADRKTQQKEASARTNLGLVPKVAGCLLLLGLLGSTTNAQKALSVEEAVAIGLSRNVQIKLAEMEELKTRFSTQEAKSGMYPAVSANASYIRNVKAPVFFFPSFSVDPATGGFAVDERNLLPITSSLKNAYSATANLSVPVYNKELSRSIKAARLNEDIAHANTGVTKAQLSDEIRRAYYAVLVAQSGRELVEGSIRRAAIALESARSLLSKGYNSDADTLAAFVNYQAVRVGLIRYDNGIRQSANYLKSLLEIPDDSTLVLADSLTIDEPFFDKMALDVEATTLRPELVQNKAQTAAAQAEIELERSRNAPNLGLVSQYQLQAQADNFKFGDYRWPNSLYVGLQLNIPIFSGFRNKIRVQAAQKNVEQIGLQRVQLQKQFNLELTNAVLSLQETLATWKAQTDIIPSAERSLQFITSRWQKGFAKYSEVADAELTLVQARNNQLQAAYNHLLAKAAYLKATGKN